MKFYECIISPERNQMVKIGERYAIFEEDQSIVRKETDIIIRNFGIVEKTCLKQIDDVCDKCGMINKGKIAKNNPYDVGYYLCTCNFNFENVKSISDSLGL